MLPIIQIVPISFIIRMNWRYCLSCIHVFCILIQFNLFYYLIVVRHYVMLKNCIHKRRTECHKCDLRRQCNEWYSSESSTMETFNNQLRHFSNRQLSEVRISVHSSMSTVLMATYLFIRFQCHPFLSLCLVLTSFPLFHPFVAAQDGHILLSVHQSIHYRENYSILQA